MDGYGDDSAIESMPDARYDLARFDYLIDKIAEVQFISKPFQHLYIPDFFTAGDFSQITSEPEVSLPPVATDDELIAALHERNFKEIEFPGTTTNVKRYLASRAGRASRRNMAVPPNLVEGYGVTMRLQKTRPGSLLAELDSFFKSRRFWEALATKFAIDLDEVRVDVGLQKYLDGYEISPHPDIRKKALTFMLNINPAKDSEAIDYHTRYLKFKQRYEHLGRFWEQNPDIDRAWVKWGFCNVHWQQTKNNSLVVFAPGNDTLHAVKASYDHLATQRTQYYGNLWYHEKKAASALQWQDLLREAEPLWVPIPPKRPLGIVARGRRILQKGLQLRRDRHR